jgi:hypothetical protein
MDEVMLTFYCAPADADALAVTLRAVAGQPVHLRAETVHGRDFADARIAEQVAGTLNRAALDVIAPRKQADALITAVGRARRAQPVRWVITPVAARGRLP